MASHVSRKVRHVEVTRHPAAEWIAQIIANELALSHGLALRPASTEYWLLVDLVRRGALEGAHRRLRRARGDYNVATGDPLFATAADPLSGAQPGPGLSFAELIDYYQADPGRCVAEKTRGNRRSMFNVLMEIIGRDRPACDGRLCFSAGGGGGA